MARGWLRAATLLWAATAVHCGAGDHSTGSLEELFARSRAGSGAAGRNSAGSGTAAGAPSRSSAAGSGGVAHAGAAGAPRAGAAGVRPVAGRSGAGGAGTPAVETMSPPSGAAGTGSATSSCDAGYLAVSGECVCDLNGVFAFYGRAEASLPATPPLEALSDTIELWGIVRQTYDAQGQLELALSACGQTSPDICVAAQPPLLPTAEAYAQYVPVEIWDKPGTAVSAQFHVPAALPGAAFDTPALAQLFGVTLADALGAWPATRKDIEGGQEFDGSALNGARWLDLDADGQLGMTIMVVPPGGVAASPNAGPVQSYAATSSKCPRSNPAAARTAYAYLPLPQGLGVKRIKRFYAAQRLTLELRGALENCDRISGTLTGAGGGELTIDAVFGGCTTVNGAGESPCGAALIDSASGGGQMSAGIVLTTGSFVLARAPSDLSCAQARSLPLD